MKREKMCLRTLGGGWGALHNSICVPFVQAELGINNVIHRKAIAPSFDGIGGHVPGMKPGWGGGVSSPPRRDRTDAT